MTHKENCCCKEKNGNTEHIEECKEKHAKKEDCKCHCNETGPCH
jgi:hypothetical protein